MNKKQKEAKLKRLYLAYLKATNQSEETLSFSTYKDMVDTHRQMLKLPN